MMIPIVLRPVDQQRAARMMLSALEGNKPAIEQTLGEAAGDPEAGVAGLLFALLAIACDVATESTSPSDAVDQLERALLRLSDDDDEGGDAA